MIKRYYPFILGKRTTFFRSNILTASTAQTSTYSTVISGAVGSVVTLKVTTLTHTSGSAVFKVNGTQYFLNDTFTVTIGSNGLVTITEFLDAGATTSGTVLETILTIMSTTKGAIGNPSTQQNTKIP